MEVIYLKSLEKDLKKIKDKKILQNLSQIFIGLELADSLFTIGNVKKISGHPEAYRIRVGDYRLGIYYADEIITVVRFLKRNDIYKLFP